MTQLTGLPLSDRGEAWLLRSGGLLLVARAAQTLFGAATFVVLTRRLGPAGFGEVLAASGVASVVGAVVGTALSDAAVTAGADPLRGGRVTGAVALASAGGVGSAWIVSGGDWDVAVAAFGAAIFVVASAATAPRTAAARVAGDARRLSLLQVTGALATLAVVGVLASAGVARWGPYVLAYAAQPAALLFLRPPGRGTGGGVLSLREVLAQALPFLLSQAVWPLLGLTNIVVLRALSGPVAVGRYGVMIRILDLVGVVGPLLGTFALPAFARLQRQALGRRSSEIARLNLTIAAAATLPVVAGMHLAWLGWRLAYSDLRFPVVTFAVLAVVYGVNSACGLPDRILQSGGAAPVVARAACAALAGLAVLSPLLISWASLVGAGVALLVAVGGVNVAMLVATRPERSVAAGHLLIMAVVVGAAGAVASGWASGSVSRSSLLMVAWATPLLAGVVLIDRGIRRAESRP